MKKTLALITIITFLAMNSYIVFEPEMTNAAEDFTAVSVTVTTEITISCDTTATLVGAINSISGGSATTSFTCTVTTPDTLGWNLTVKKDQTLQRPGGGANKEFTDYASTTSPTDYDWLAGNPVGDGNEVFGFELESGSQDAVAIFKDNGSDTCGSGSVSDEHCWAYFPTTPTTYKVASSNSPTDGGGDAVIFDIKADAGGSNFLEPGAYTNTITATATAGVP